MVGLSNSADRLLGNLAHQTDFIEVEKLRLVEQHLAQFEEFPGEFPQNWAMFNRLKTFSLYHPDVIEAFPDQFNKNWFNAWGIEK